MSASKRQPFRLNAPGDFYVEDGMCITCLAPERAAPDLMGFYADPSGANRGSHCFFARQPTTPEQVEQAITAVDVSCCGALRYGGTDRSVLRRLSDLGYREACDHPGAASMLVRVWRRITRRWH